MEAVSEAGLTDLDRSGDVFPGYINSGQTPSISLKILEQIRFNYHGDLFDVNGVIEDSFPGYDAYLSRDIARFQRRFNRLGDRCEVLDGSYLWITDRYSHFYYHWFCDALPRLAALLEDNQCQERQLLVPRRVYDKNYVRESLKYWPEIEVLVPPVADRIGVAEHLFLMSRLNETPMVNSEYVEKVANKYRLQTDMSSTGINPKRVYVSRRNARVRRIVNEADIIPILERYDFEILAMEELSLRDQINLMAQTDILVGAHGGGLTNMIFLRPNVPVLELRREHGPPPCFYNLAKACGHPWHMLACDPVHDDWHHHSADIAVDPEILDSKLTTIIGS
ncbi:MAG: glycosyltransferase family 61 protein [Rhizobiaceae bacterium]